MVAMTAAIVAVTSVFLSSSASDDPSRAADPNSAQLGTALSGPPSDGKAGEASIDEAEGDDAQEPALAALVESTPVEAALSTSGVVATLQSAARRGRGGGDRSTGRTPDRSGAARSAAPSLPSGGAATGDRWTGPVAAGPGSASSTSPQQAGTGGASAAAQPPASTGAGTADLRSYGAACDGTTNDRAALQRAVTDMTARRGIVTVTGNCRISTTATTAAIALAGPITIRGTSPGATLALDTDQAGAFRQLFSVTGDGVTLENLTLRRASDLYGIMIILHGVSGFRLDGVVIDGAKTAFPRNIFHGVAIWGDSGDLTNTAFVRTTIRDTDYGLLQDSGVRTATVGFTVDRSTFTANHLDDLEFNSPNGRMTTIAVTNSSFTDNRARTNQTAAGFGIGLANVQGAVIRGNDFDGYPLDPVHIEDRSAQVTIENNTFRNSFTAGHNFASHIFVVSGSHDITIRNNTFDTAANRNRIDCVYVGPGGGRPVSNVSVTDNVFRLRPNTRAVGNYGSTGLREGGNTTQPLP